MDQLDTPERIALYLEAAFEDGDPTLIAAAIGDAAHTRDDADRAGTPVAEGHQPA